MEKYLKIFKALGDQSRLRIVIMLSIRPLCVCEIREIIGSSMSTISNHLKILKEADIIKFQKEDKYVNYELNIDNEFVVKMLSICKEIDDELLTDDYRKVIVTDRANIC